MKKRDKKFRKNQEFKNKMLAFYQDIKINFKIIKLLLINPDMGKKI
jgi:hypothetical protein